MANWGKARKKPIIVEFRDVIPNDFIINEGVTHAVEIIKTREGTLLGYVGSDLVIKGIQGEIYPIGKNIFFETYDIVEPIQSSGETTNE